jgi:DUF177 domain-containing protein
MLRLDLNRLAREGSVAVEAKLPADAPLWDESGISWAGPVDVSLTASHAGTGEIVVRGSVEGALEQECKRCLKPVKRSLEHDLTVVFVASDSPGAEDDDGVHLYDPSDELDLGSAVREEVILAADPYVVCDPGCQGLCPRCGVNRNVDSCSCSTDEPDPRWEALRALKKSE